MREDGSGKKPYSLDECLEVESNEAFTAIAPCKGRPLKLPSQ